MPKLMERDVSEKDFAAHVRATLTGELITDYPKMLYRAGSPAAAAHWHVDGPLKVANVGCDYITVSDADEELAALEAGWSVSVPSEPKKEARRGNAG